MSVKHHHLLKIYTDENTLELTANHPLYFKGYGLSSLAKIRSKLKAESFLDLEGQIKVLTWNKQLQKTEYKTIESIRQLKGAVQTHSILKLSKGENYIANGFISKGTSLSYCVSITNDTVIPNLNFLGECFLLFPSTKLSILNLTGNL